MFVAVVLALGLTDWALVVRRSNVVVGSPNSVSALAAAEVSVAQILSYDYRSYNADLVTAADASTGTFLKQLESVGKSLVGPTATTNHVVTTSVVTTGSVVSEHASQVVVLLAIEQLTESKLLKGTQRSASSVTATMQRVDDRWLVAGLTVISP